jgi:beta-N-acetylhexosaminidase
MMRKCSLFRLFFILLLTLSIIAGCSNDKEVEVPNNGNPAEELPGYDIPELEPTKEELLMERIAAMSIGEKLGQLVMIGIESPEATPEELELISDGKAGGIIFFQRNIIDSDKFIELVNILKNENISSDIPLFLGIDEEGGRVARLSGIFPNLPAISEIGRMDDPDIAYEYGAIQAEKLNRLGLNINFSPVLDVASNPNNPIIGDRSISSDPIIVSENGTQLIRAMVVNDIIPVGKHFPGHGDTQVDSHVALPVIDKSLEELKQMELVPFEYAIREKIPALMVGHLLVRALDNKPATVSGEIINGLLRNKLGFDGVVFSDDMTMGAITENYSIDDAALKFIQAGGDVALICHGTQPVKDFLMLLNSAVLDGSFTEDELNKRVFRILKLKDEMYLTNDESMVSVDYDLTERINNLKVKMGE